MEQITADVAIIGAGPAGLFAAFECGMLKLSAVLLDALPELGGQCVALYPEKPIYDIPAHPAIEGGELIARLEEQIAPFKSAKLLGRQVVALEGAAGAFLLRTSDGDEVRVKAVIIAAGAGAFGPNRPPLEGLSAYEASGAIKYFVKRREDLRGKRTAMDMHFHMHHFAHAQNDLRTGNSLGGIDGKAMAQANKKQAAGE